MTPHLTTYTVAVSAVIAASATACYVAIADYRNGHPHIVPRKWFGPIIVEEGGVGAGTRIRFTMTVLGQTVTLRAEVTEPVPGRVLVESYPDTGVVTTFTVVETAPGQSRVTIETRTPRVGGVRAAIACYHASSARSSRSWRDTWAAASSASPKCCAWADAARRLP
jgi:hypothetical protein